MKTKTKDIYIIKNDINNKVYIGQSYDPLHRWEQYKSAVKHHPNAQIITRAMHLYGIEKFHMEILESNVVNYDEREKYWIRENNSLVPNGYNIAEGGQGTGVGVDSSNASIKSEDVLNEFIEELLLNIEPISTLAKKFGISNDVAYAINNGRVYYNSELNYPIRSSSRYSEEKLKQITYSLKYELDKSLKNIAEEYGICLGQLNEINQGKAQKREYLDYPIRKGKMILAKETHPQIQELLLNSTLLQKEIAQKFNVSELTVCNINMGRICYNDKLDYPLRKIAIKSNRTCLSPDILNEICGLIINSTFSLKEIAKKYEIPTSTIQGINSGKIVKYRNEELYKYPLRKKRPSSID